jgi:hypothetical protein
VLEYPLGGSESTREARPGRRGFPFLGLVVTLPVLGHTTWHLYRRIIAPMG